MPRSSDIAVTKETKAAALEAARRAADVPRRSPDGPRAPHYVEGADGTVRQATTPLRVLAGWTKLKYDHLCHKHFGQSNGTAGKTTNMQRRAYDQLYRHVVDLDKQRGTSYAERMQEPPRPRPQADTLSDDEARVIRYLRSGDGFKAVKIITGSM